jgi:16S rRNA (guanine527-N7)-methyltransferase
VTPDEGPAAPVDPLAEDPRVVAWLGDAYPTVRRFGELLADQGVLRGLMGPREMPRLWERHLLNSAAVAAELPAGVVADIGSGAGLPGVVLAAMRPDVHMVLVEPMERRCAWLSEVVGELGLDAEVRRARSEELCGRLLVDAVTARAVAPLDKLAGWTLPLLREGGVLVALKGDRAEDELVAARDAIAALGGDEGVVREARSVDGVPSTRVVRVVRVAAAVEQRPMADRVGGNRTAVSRGERSRRRRGGRSR